VFRPAGNIIDLNQDQDKRPPMPLGA